MERTNWGRPSTLVRGAFITSLAFAVFLLFGCGGREPDPGPSPASRPVAPINEEAVSPPPGPDLRVEMNKAMLRGDADRIKALIAQGADVNARDDDGNTMLYGLCQRGSAEMGEFLLAKGADVNARVDDGSADPSRATPLHIAAGQGHVAVAEFLLTSGADISARDCDGETPLHKAASRGKHWILMVRLLVSHGADRTARSNKGETAAEMCARERPDDHAEVLKAMDEASAPATRPS